MSNKISNCMKEDVAALLPILHQTYHAIGRFQKKRDSTNEARLLAQLEVAGLALRVFKPFVQPRKRAYFDAVMMKELPTSDRLIALDIDMVTCAQCNTRKPISVSPRRRL